MAENTRVRREVRQVLAGVLLLDLVAIAIAILVGWDLRLNVDSSLWAAEAVPELALSSTVGPWIGLAWILLLAIYGAYSSRHFGAGAGEFKAVILGSLFTLGAVGLSCYLVKVDLSRGFLLLTFLIGIPMLLAERYAVRKLVHRARNRGRLVRRVVAVGGPADVAELVAVLHRERSAGYEIVGACVPE